MAVRSQPAPLRLELGQDLADQPPEGGLVVRLPQMAELVHDHVFEHRRRREDQAPVQVDPALGAAAAPQPLLFLDPHGGGQQIVRP